MAASKKKPRAVYDPEQTPLGQQLRRQSRSYLDATDRANSIRQTLNKIPPVTVPVGRGQAYTTPPLGSAILPRGRNYINAESLDRARAAGDAYDRQQSAAASGFSQHLATPGEKPMPAPKKKPAAATYQPRMTDPVSGAKLQRGRPVAAANPAAPDYMKLNTVQPSVQRAGPTGPFGPQYDRADYGRATANGDVMKKGQPVPPVYSGGLNDRIGLGLDAAGRALGMGFGPPASPAAPARRPVAPARAAPTMAANPGAFGRAAPMPPSRRAPAANDATIASVSKGMKNSPGYQDFPPPKKRKGY